MEKKLSVLLIYLLMTVFPATIILGIVFHDDLYPPKDVGFMHPADSLAPLHWAPEHIPLKVFLSTNLSEWDKEVQEACEWWNKQTKTNLFIYRGMIPELWLPKRPGFITITSRGNTKGGGHTRLRYNKESGEIGYAPVYLDNETIQIIRKRVVAHELGHVLGLAHDENLSESVMVKKAYIGDFIVTKADIELLQQTYNNRNNI
jgi:hypothetical protein